jgi:hypothetical protein
LVLEDLSHGRLTDIEVRISLEVTGGDLGVGFDHHERGSCKVERAIEASSVTMAVDSAGDGERSVTGSVGDAETDGGDEQDDHALIHAAIPSRRRSTSPCRSPLTECARTLRSNEMRSPWVSDRRAIAPMRPWRKTATSSP